MPSLKQVLKHPTTQRALSVLIAGLIRVVMLTSRKEFRVHPQAQRYMSGEDNAIFAFWHGRMMLLPAINPPRKMHVLISLHRDGLLISQVIARFGQATIAGSSSQGGSAAMRNMIRILRHGDNISVTPDGPRGPNQHVHMGIVATAALAGKPILPITFSATRHRRMRSWDRFMVALPFARIVFCVGAPIMVQEANETTRLQVEQAMNELVATADAL
jgi:lysophospholipid acyltransferase (LPLAT)-like uncharacterized protein